MDEGSVLDFLTSLEAMQLPDRIEEVNAKILDKVVEEHTYVAAVFCECAEEIQESHGGKTVYLSDASYSYD